MKLKWDVIKFYVSWTAEAYPVIFLISGQQGDYWRLLVPGQYEVKACAAPKYKCVGKMVTITNPRHTEAQVVNFILPAATAKSQKREKFVNENQVFNTAEVNHVTWINWLIFSVWSHLHLRNMYIDYLSAIKNWNIVTDLCVCVCICVYEWMSEWYKLISDWWWWWLMFYCHLCAQGRLDGPS